MLVSSPAHFRIVVNAPIASARATRLLAISPYWLTSFAPRGQELSLFTRVKRKMRTVFSTAWSGFRTQLQICRCRLPSCHPALRLACYPFFLTASESRLQFYCPKCTCPGRVIANYAHALYFTEIASYIHSSEAGCILMYALVVFIGLRASVTQEWGFVAVTVLWFW